MVIQHLKNKLFSLKGYILIGIILLHAAILPVLYITITNSHKRVSNEQFISNAREVSGLISDMLSAKDPYKEHDLIINLLESAVLGGRILYIDITRSGIVTFKPMDIQTNSAPEYLEDINIGGNNDNIYYLSIPVSFINADKASYLLRIGFDESLLMEEYKSLSTNTLYILLTYFLFIIIFITIITSWIMKPLKSIRLQSKEIASGKTHVPIVHSSRISDIGYLAHDLETMRLSLTKLANNMEYKATHDDLTDLPNRFLFMDRLNSAISLSTRQNKTFSLLLIDLNRFKEFNDTLGHSIGDKILVAIASRMINEIRDSDTLARLGGDEFCIILNDTGQIVAEKIASKLNELITQPTEINHHMLQVGASIGIAVFPIDGGDSETLLQHADIAMYFAKHNNINVASYHTDMDTNNYEKLILSHDIRNSISSGHFQAYFQPKYKLPENKIYGCELLLRWNHPTQGIIMPDIFIPIAEQENLIGNLTITTLNDYLHLFKPIIEKIPNFHIAINVSPNDLIDSSLFNAFKHLIEANPFLANRIYIEVTENAIMKNPIRSAAILNKFNEAGIHVSVDDFGTGYSSLAYLQKFPIKELKIDKSFISELSRGSNNYPIVSATITMAHDLNLCVVAEGVESNEILNLLIEMGCDCSQGNYHSSPVDFDTLHELVALSEHKPV